MLDGDFVIELTHQRLSAVKDNWTGQTFQHTQTPSSWPGQVPHLIGEDGGKQNHDKLL